MNLVYQSRLLEISDFDTRCITYIFPFTGVLWDRSRLPVCIGCAIDWSKCSSDVTEPPFQQIASRLLLSSLFTLRLPTAEIMGLQKENCNSTLTPNRSPKRMKKHVACLFTFLKINIVAVLWWCKSKKN